ncbi:MAG: hypothetical protein ACUVT9_05355 [Candidatus Bathycorpusculaceae bacterium]
MELKIVALTIIMIVAVALISLALAQNVDADFNDVATAVAAVSVPLGFMGILMAYLFDSKAPKGSCIVSAGALGLVFAYILKVLYDKQIFLKDSVLANIGAGVSIGDLMAVTVIFFIMVGLLFEVTRK